MQCILATTLILSWQPSPLQLRPSMLMHTGREDHHRSCAHHIVANEDPAADVTPADPPTEAGFVYDPNAFALEPAPTMDSLPLVGKVVFGFAALLFLFLGSIVFFDVDYASLLFGCRSGVTGCAA